MLIDELFQYHSFAVFGFSDLSCNFVRINLLYLQYFIIYPNIFCLDKFHFLSG